MEVHLKKNEAAYITFPMVTTASPETFDTGETVSDTAYYKDGAGSWTSLAITDAVTEISTTGMYSIDLTAGEMNHDLIAIKFTSTNAADTMVMVRTYAVDVDDLVRSTTPANTLDVTAAGEAGIDLDNTSGTIAAAQIATGAITAAKFAAGALDAAALATDAVAEIADGVWDELITTGAHNTAQSAGQRLRQVDQAFVVLEGTAVAGSTSTTINLDSSADGTSDDIYAGDRVIIIAGTGIGEHGIVGTYASSTKIATMTQAWVVTPSTDSEYLLIPADADIESWQHSAVTNSTTSQLPEVDAKSISDSTAAADNLEASALGIITGSAQTGTLSNTSCTTDLTGYTDDQLIGRVIIFTSGAAAGEATDITDYANTNGQITYTALSGAIAPANNDTFVVV